jgi:amino acid permease
MIAMKNKKKVVSMAIVVLICSAVGVVDAFLNHRHDRKQPTTTGSTSLPSTTRSSRIHWIGRGGGRRARNRRRQNNEQSNNKITSSTAAASAAASSSVSSSSSSPSLAHVAGVSFTVVKAMLGTGMLALPLGVAAASNHKSALIPATILLQLLALMSAYTFALYGRLAHAMPQAATLQEMWRTTMNSGGGAPSSRRGKDKETSDVDGGGGAIISVTNFMFCFGCCLAISLILGDTFSSLAQGALSGGAAPLLPAWCRSRQSLILAVTAVFLLPLCQLKSLTALAPFSMIGVMGAFTTVGFLGYRCPAVFATSPYATGGVWEATASATTFGTYSRIFSLAPLSLVSMSCIALMAHFSAIDFYKALLPTTTNDKASSGVGTGTAVASSSSVLRNFMAMTIGSFAVTALISNLAMAFGFLTFGADAAGNILNNYHVNDRGAILSRLLCGVSLIGSFPMVMRPCQGAALELLKLPPTDRNRVRMTNTLLAVVTALALTVKNVGFVISLNGAIMGTSLIYTIPCLLFLKLTEKDSSSSASSRGINIGGGDGGVTRLKVERAICRLLIGFGLTAMVAGAATAVITSFYPHLLS